MEPNVIKVSAPQFRLKKNGSIKFADYLMQRKFVADRARLRRANPFTSHHRHRMDRRSDVDAPIVEEFVEFRIAQR